MVALVLAACDRQPQTARVTTPPTPPPAPAERCFADEIGELRPDWKPRAACNHNRSACRKACFSGDGDSCFNLAIAVQLDGDLHNDEISDYFKRACRSGLASGCTNWAAGEWLGSSSREWSCLYRIFDRSCDSGEPFGCSMTARMLIEESRTPFDRWVAFVQLTNACNAFEGPPCRFLALYIEQGSFGPPDPTGVKTLLERACRGGDPAACGKSTAAATLH